MVRLENIQSDGITISCDYFPEDTNEKGFLEVNSDGDIIRVKYAESDKRYVYASFAIRKLVRLLSSGEEIPSSSGAMWY